MDSIIKLCQFTFLGFCMIILLIITYFECEFFYKDNLEEGIGSALTARVTIEELEMDLFDVKWKAKNVLIGGPDSQHDLPALSVENLELDIALIPYLLSDTLRFETMFIENPVVIFRGDLTDNNLRSLHQALDTYDPDQEIHLDATVPGTQVVQINQLIVEGGQLIVKPADGSPEQIIKLRNYDVGPIGRGQEQTWSELTGKGLHALEYFIRPVL